MLNIKFLEWTKGILVLNFMESTEAIACIPPDYGLRGPWTILGHTFWFSNQEKEILLCSFKDELYRLRSTILLDEVPLDLLQLSELLLLYEELLLGNLDIRVGLCWEPGSWLDGVMTPGRVPVRGSSSKDALLGILWCVRNNFTTAVNVCTELLYFCKFISARKK